MKHVIVLGGGHNGLVAANYLADASIAVTVLEARDSFGGVVGRVEYMPGYFASITNSIGSFEATVYKDLDLDQYGLKFMSPKINLLQPFADSLFVGWQDKDLVAAQMNYYADGEAQRHRNLISKLDDLGKSLGVSLWQAPNNVEDVLDNLSATDQAFFKEYFLDGSLNNLLDDHLESDQIKSMMQMLALNAQMVSPDSPGSAAGLLLRPISRASNTEDVLGNQNQALRGSVGIPLGSMAAIIDALVARANSKGVSLRTNAAVDQVIYSSANKPTKVILTTGEELENFDYIVSTIEPSRLEKIIQDDAVADKSHINWPDAPNGSAFKMAIALNDLPAVANAPKELDVHQALMAQFRIGPSTEYIQKAIEDGIAGRVSADPLIWGMIPSLSSPSLAPNGKHLLSLNVWHAPHELGAEYWQENAAAFAQRCIETVKILLPDIENKIHDIAWLTPFEIENEFFLTGSNITHGDMTTRQLFEQRSAQGIAHALKEKNIILGGAGAWPGGYVTGAPGKNAANQIIKLLKKDV